MLRQSLNLFGVTLDGVSSDITSYEDTEQEETTESDVVSSDEDEQDDVPAESTESVEDVEPLDDDAVSSSAYIPYDDTALLESLSVIDARLQDANSTMSVLQEQGNYSFSLLIWTLGIVGGLLLTYLFYRIAKIFM